MIEFDWYIKRARINLDTLFEVENIKSDQDLLDYCKRKNLSPPLQKYFAQSKIPSSSPPADLVVPKAENKTTRRVRKTTKPVEDPQQKVEEVDKKPAPKKTTTRSRTRKRTTRSKSKSE